MLTPEQEVQWNKDVAPVVGAACGSWFALISKTTVCLDGEFTIVELEIIVAALKKLNPPPVYKNIPTPDPHITSAHCPGTQPGYSC